MDIPPEQTDQQPMSTESRSTLSAMREMQNQPHAEIPLHTHYGGSSPGQTPPRARGAAQKSKPESPAAANDFKTEQPLWKTVWQFLKWLNTELSYTQLFHAWIYARED